MTAIFADIGDQPSFDHYMDLKFYLEDNFNCPVDLVLDDSVKPGLRQIIKREVAYAYRLSPLSG